MIEAKLRVISGSRVGEEFRLVKGQELIFGRGAGSTVQILDKGLSRVHFKVAHGGEELVGADLESSNGSFVNGARVKSAVLRDGDLITIGNTEISVAIAAPPSPGGDVVIDATTDDLAEPEPGTRVRRKFDPASTGFHLAPPDAAVEQMRRANERLAVLYRVGSLVNQEGALDRSFHAILDGVMASLAPDRAFVIMLDRNTGAFRAVASRWAPGCSRGDRIAISTTILRECTTGKVSVLTTNASEDERFREGHSIIQGSICSAMAAPIEAHGDIFGAIYVDTVTRDGAFSETDLELLSALGAQAGGAIRRARLVEDLENLFYGSVRSLVAAIDAKDKYTHGHSERVMQYAVQIARELGIDEQGIRTVRLASLFHDIGKIGIPEAVLNKPGRLDEDEYRLIMEHPVIGARILSSIAGIQNMDEVIQAVRHHHERWDGRGFPDGLSAEDIPVAARVIAVSDSFDAMTSTRAYRKPLGAGVVVDEFKKYAGVQWDPTIVLRATSLISDGRLGPGRLEDSETGVV